MSNNNISIRIDCMHFNVRISVNFSQKKKKNKYQFVEIKILVCPEKIFITIFYK